MYSKDRHPIETRCVAAYLLKSSSFHCKFLLTIYMFNLVTSFLKIYFNTFFLTERFQSVKIGSTLSDLQKLLFGVLQGSVLGPLLFSLYTSPLSTLIGKHKGINFHFYADDSQLYVHLSHMNASAAFDKLNRCLQDVKEWMSASKLKLNPDTTQLSLYFLARRNRDKG